MLSLMPRELPAAKASQTIQWTQEESDFIKNHPEIRLGVDPTFVPYEFFDTDGVYKGIAPDYIELICNATGLKMTPEKGLTWTQAYEKAVGKELDVLPCVSKTTEREKYFLFSEGYYTFQRVLFINENNKKIKSFDDLMGKRVAVQVNSSHHSFLMDYPTISLALYTTVEEALHAVSDGREEAFVGNLSTSSYLIKKYGIANLRYITIYSEKPQQLYFAVRNDWPVLVGILNKALNSIEQEDKIAISNKWIAVQSGADYSELIQMILMIGGLVALVLAVSLFWIIRLRKEIARRKKAQAEMVKAKNEAEQANQVKSLFLARMSHEVRTPLNAILGMSYLIKKTGLTPTQSSYLDKLTQSAHNMLDIINDILDFSKIESRKMEIEIISFDLDKLLQRITNIVSVKVAEKEIEFYIQKSPDMPTRFMGDPTRIEQILINLVNNAVKFTSRGSVTVKVESQKLENLKYLLSFCVEDTGIGMSEEQTKRLFVPFDQGDSSINRRFGGTGLGLSIVKSLTDMMNGHVEVQSELNKGSSFMVQLPLEADPNQTQESAKKMSADCFSTIRALVLDASENTRNMMGDYLKAFGIAHKLTTNEDDAVQTLRKAAVNGEKEYNLLIVDYMTPQDGGIAFLERIRKAMYFKPTSKCILIVPMTREDLLENLSDHGINFGFAKPIIPSTLYNAILEQFSINPPSKAELEPVEDTFTAPYPYHLLLVEDNQTNQFIAQSILNAAGFSLSTADNGQEGVDAYKAHRDETDLILMDIHMPVMDGYTASTLIRAEDPEIPIIAMTADAVVGVEEKCKSSGINYYVSKPFEPEAFIRTVLDALKDKPCKGKAPEPLQEEKAKENTGEPDEEKSVQEPSKAVAEQPASEKTEAAPEHTTGTEPSEAPLNEPEAHTENAPLIDSTGAMQWLGIDHELYIAILEEFWKENQQTGQTLQDQVTAGDFASAAQTVHKVKSSSSSIGAKMLSECAGKLQKAFEQNETNVIHEENTRFRQLFEGSMREIQALLNARP